MNFTRQDLQKISNYLGRLSVKDSQFKKLDNVAGSDLLTMLHDGKNVTATIASLLSYVQDNMSLASIPVSISGLSSTTLLGVLNDIYSLASTPQTPDGTKLHVNNIKCNSVIDGTTYNMLNELLDYLLYQTATKAEVENIIK